jgi:hypothetical protein
VRAAFTKAVQWLVLMLEGVIEEAFFKRKTDECRAEVARLAAE